MKCLIILFLFVVSSVEAQVTDTIEVGYTKSAYLIFEDVHVKHDVGSEDVAVKNAENKLVIQAIEEGFAETNLFVECAGKIYMFIIVYNDFPSKYVYDYTKKDDARIKPKENESEEVKTGDGYILKTSDNNVKEVDTLSVQICERILKEDDRILNRGVVKYKIAIYLKDIVIKNNKMFLEFEIQNRGNIPYVIDFYQYRVKSVKKRIKGESFQEVLLSPLLEYKRPKVIEGNTTVKYVIVMDKFVLTQQKKLVIEHWEYNGDDLNIEGGRKVDFDVFSKDILNVRL